MTDHESISEEGERLYHKMLGKTAIRSLIWLFIAYVITYYYPEQTWIWYIVMTFIVLGVAFTLLMLFIAKRHAQLDDEQVD